MRIEEFLQDWIDEGKPLPVDVKIAGSGSTVTDPKKFVNHHLKALDWTRFCLEEWAKSAGIWSDEPGFEEGGDSGEA